MRNTKFMLVLSGLLFLSVQSNGFCDQAAKASAAAEISPEQKAMQERMMSYTTVNENHDFLKKLEGKWKATVKFWMDPAGEPEVSVGTSDAKIIMGGRFLEQAFVGTAMGQPFEGRGILGYDNLKQEYTSIWFDNMATGIMAGSGQYDPETKMLTSEGSMSCPITEEKHRWMKDVTSIKDEDNYIYETYMKDKDGNEFRSMEIVYERIK